MLEDLTSYPVPRAWLTPLFIEILKKGIDATPPLREIYNKTMDDKFFYFKNLIITCRVVWRTVINHVREGKV